MRFVSPVALGLMLALGAASFGAASPAAMAKEKEAKAKAPKLKPSPGIIAPLQKAQKAIGAKDFAAAKAALPEVEAQIKTPDDRYYYNSTMLNLSIGVNDAAMQNTALRGMLDTGLVPVEQAGQFSSIVANNAVNAKDYDAAIAYAEKARALNYKPEQVYPILAQAIWGKAGNDKAEVARGLEVFAQGVAAMKAAGQAVPAQWYQVGVSKAAALDALPQLRQWAGLAYDAEPTGENLRTILRVFQRENPTMTNRENLDLLRLMRVSGGLAIKPDYLEYAEMAFKGGLFGEVKSVIDAGRVARDQRTNLVLTSTDGNDFYTVASQRIAADKATLGAAERDAAKSATGKIAAATADAYMGYGDYAKAIALYEMAAQKGGVDVAEVNTRIGISKVMAGDLSGARSDFAKVTGGSRGGLAKLWLQYIDGKTKAAAAPAAAKSAS